MCNILLNPFKLRYFRYFCIRYFRIINKNVILLKRIKYLGINQGGERFLHKNCKALLKDLISFIKSLMKLGS